MARRGTFISLHDALRVSPLFFWGDLDLAGLDIYRRLKNHLPSIELSAMYQPLIDDLRIGQGHVYDGTQKERQHLGAHSYPELQKLEDLCRNRGIDQEYHCVTNESLKLADKSLVGLEQNKTAFNDARV